MQQAVVTAPPVALGGVERRGDCAAGGDVLVPSSRVGHVSVG